LNAGLNPANLLVDDGWCVTGLEEGDEPDPAILICDLDFETRLEILETENREGDQALGRKVVALLNIYFIQNEVSHTCASSVGCPAEKQQTRSSR
jgi:hypothetical protein